MTQEIEITDKVRAKYGDDVVVFIRKDSSEESDYVVVGDCVQQVAAAIDSRLVGLAALFSQSIEFTADNLDKIAKDCIKAGLRCAFV